MNTDDGDDLPPAFAAVLDLLPFALRHSVAGAVFVIGFSVVPTMLYFGLLLLAIIFDKGVGNPALIVLVPVGSFVLSLSVMGFMLFPVTALAEWICSGWLNMSSPVQIPVAYALLYLESLGLALVMNSFYGVYVFATANVVILLMAVPLGVYLCGVLGTSMILSFGKWILGSLKCRWFECRNAVDSRCKRESNSWEDKEKYEEDDDRE